MDIQFFFDPEDKPRSREDVRIKQIGIFVHEGGRRVSYGLELTPFLERPCIDVEILNGQDEPAGMLSVIEQIDPNFSLVLHLRDEEAHDPYRLLTVIYYITPETDPVMVDKQIVTFNTAEEGEHRFPFEEES
ncbi:MAG: hypothetical protein ACK2U5_03130 [Candidatus Promineifilaceae bacterium]